MGLLDIVYIYISYKCISNLSDGLWQLDNNYPIVHFFCTVIEVERNITSLYGTIHCKLISFQTQILRQTIITVL